MKRNIASILASQLKILLILGVATSQASGANKSELFEMDEITEKKRVLNERKTALRKRRSAMETVTRYTRGLTKVESDLLGEGGLRWKLASWQAGFDAYMDQWSLLINILKWLDETNVASKVNDFEKALVDTYDGFRTVEINASSLRQRLKEQREFIGSLQPIPAQSMADQLTASDETLLREDFKTKIDDLNSLRDSLSRSFEEMEQNLAADYLSEFRETINELRRLLDNKVRLLGLRFPELDEVVKRAESLIKIMEVTSNSLGKLKAEVFLFESLIDKSAIFKARASYEKVEKIHQSVMATFDQLPGDDLLKKFSRDLANSYFDRSKILLNETLRTKSERQMFVRFAKRQFQRISRQCNQNIQTSEANCEGFRAISRFPIKSSDLRERMNAGDITRDDLAFIEGKLIDFDHTWEVRL